MKPRTRSLAGIASGLFLVILAFMADISAAAPVVYLAGDSTVATNGPGNYPQQGWGGRIAGYLAMYVDLAHFLWHRDSQSVAPTTTSGTERRRCLPRSISLPARSSENYTAVIAVLNF